ncbi:carboxymuconolactone decarboxylase family protein [Alicyclobacillus dauci]|uniref:Carboxymuconolactone decarboxylase family protein n=1 Tax=Alicyclobacillus dauci TaxID=1475485 RepID=A0ABY6Z3R8_9BACL|nr:carboxymuconolactone decarboxylase family protein [Alicyclobacillus dauci]WAH36635.1 carboxymuconolactone decarboxylase family protein [Alicyclobacillus dauci]
MDEELQGYVEASIEEFKDGLGWLAKQLPEVGERFIAYTDACFQEGEVSEKHKHLIALGIAVHAQDEYCIMFHCHNALRLGASEREILETIGVCGAFGGGAALSQGVTLVQDVMAEYQGSTQQH